MTRSARPIEPPSGSDKSRPGTIPISPPSGRAQGVADDHHVTEMLRRMRNGDRNAAATFITTYGSRVRRRVRGKLGPAMRRLFDSQEILSTVGRRLDLYVRNGKLEATGEGQLWSLVFRMADMALLEKVRVLQRLERVESSDSEFAQQLLHRLKQADTQHAEGAERILEEALLILTDTMDREILSLWLAGDRLDAIAEQFGITPAGVRKRWQRIKEKLRSHLNDNRQ